MEEIFERVKEVIGEQLGIEDIETITMETTFIDDLGADSLDIVELIMALEEEFVRAAGKCDFDIDVCYNRAVIDAKSLLGMLYLGLSKDLTVKYGGQNTGFENTVQKYAVC